MNKYALRKKMRALRKQHPTSLEDGEMLLSLLCEEPSFCAARSVLAYVAFNNEAPTEPILHHLLVADDKTLFLPNCVGEDLVPVAVTSLEGLEPGEFGILEPPITPNLEPPTLDLILLPLLAADQQGHRLGQGGGHYDRFLADSPITKIGLALDYQLIETLPREPHDVLLDALVTPTQVIQFSHTQL